MDSPTKPPPVVTSYNTREGVRYPTGIKYSAEGVNFSVFSRHATKVQLLLFDRADSEQPFQVIDLDPTVNKTFLAWHIFIEKLPAGTWYAWRMDGPDDTRESGLRFDRDKVLLDPGAVAVSQALWNRSAACKPGENTRSAMRAMVTDDDWVTKTIGLSGSCCQVMMGVHPKKGITFFRKILLTD